MSIASEITRINGNIAAAYTACADKGASMPQTRNSRYLADTIDSIPQGGTVPEKDVNFYDYDGTRLYSYTFSEALALSAMPAAPTHTGLTNEGWNYTLSQLQAVAQNGESVNVGCYFTTADGKTHIHIRLEDSADFKFYLIQQTANSAVIDWGDGSPSEMLSTYVGIYNSRAKYLAEHTYAPASYPAEYDISIAAVQGKWYGFGATNYSYSGICGDMGYGKYIRRIHLSSDASVYGPAFGYAQGAEIITMSELQVTYLDNRESYYRCNHLLFAQVNGSVPTENFYECRSLKAVSLKNCIRINYNAFYGCYNLTEKGVLTGVTSIGENAFTNCCAFKSIKLPSALTSIDSGTFINYALCNISWVDLTAFTDPASLPVLRGYFTNVFQTENYKYDTVKFYVANASMKTAFSGATNWSGGADYYVVGAPV